MLIIDSKKIRKYSKIVKFDLIHPISNPKRYQSIKHYKKKINIRKPKRRKKKKNNKKKVHYKTKRIQRDALKSAVRWCSR